jgi:quinol monooxygenase YgiN
VHGRFGRLEVVVVELKPGNKYIVGWIKLREGTEEEFDRLLEPYLETCRGESECRFFEMMRTREDPLTVLLCECFLSEEAHAIHLGRQHVKDFFNDFNRLALIGNFENVIAAEVNPDTHNFEVGSYI